MIPAIDPGIGLKEDRPAPRVLPRENPAFSTALKRATDRPQAAPSRPSEDARAPSDPRAREKYGKPSDDAEQAARSGPEQGSTQETRQSVSRDRAKAADGESQKAPAKAKTGKDKTDETATDSTELQGAAQGVVNPAVQTVPDAGATLNQAVQDPALAAASLQPAAHADAVVAGSPPQSANVGKQVSVATGATPMDAQIGAAAYRLSAHGNGEAQLAEANGTILPDSAQAQLLGEGVRDVRIASLQPLVKSDLTRSVEEAPADPRDILQPGDPSKAKHADGLSHKEQIALQTAQARNEVLARLSATGSTTAGGEQGTDPNASSTLRQQLQLQGLLARDARAHTLEPTTPHAAASTAPTAPAQVAAGGVLVPANSVNLTTLRETHRDEATGQRVVERVASEARWMINSNRQEVTFRLSPEHLGNLHMKVQHKDGVFDVQMTVDNLAAKHLLEANLQDLRNRMATENPGGQFLFNVDVRHGNEQPSLYSRAARTVPAPSARAAGLDQAPAAALAGRVMNHSGLSIYV